MTAEPQSSNDWLVRYVKLNDEYNALLEQFFPVTTVSPGRPIRVGSPTEADLEHMEDVHRRAEHAQGEWMRAMREGR